MKTTTSQLLVLERFNLKNKNDIFKLLCVCEGHRSWNIFGLLFLLSFDRRNATSDRLKFFYFYEVEMDIPHDYEIFSQKVVRSCMTFILELTRNMKIYSNRVVQNNVSKIEKYCHAANVDVIPLKTIERKWKFFFYSVI